MKAKIVSFEDLEGTKFSHKHPLRPFRKVSTGVYWPHHHVDSTPENRFEANAWVQDNIPTFLFVFPNGQVIPNVFNPIDLYP